RMGGFLGCARSNSPINHIANSVDITSTPEYDFAKPVEGYDYTGTDVGDNYALPGSIAVDNNSGNWSPTPPSSIFDVIKTYTIPGSDILVVHEASASQYDIVDDPRGSGTYSVKDDIPVAATYATDFSVGQIAVASDCQNVSIFQVTDTGAGAGPLKHDDGGTTPGNNNASATSPWAESYGQGAQVTLAETYIYFIGKSPTDNSPALFQVSLDDTGVLGTPVELVPDIENMQIVYGVDTDNDKVPNQYVSAATVDTDGKWGSVVSVRVALITRSDDFIVEQTPATAQVLDLDGVNVTVPLDRRLRREFVQTISLRNMLP
ncbi:MAG: PilW family protein, partial [Gammaproteobacteria bacterium]